MYTTGVFVPSYLTGSKLSVYVVLQMQNVQYSLLRGLACFNAVFLSSVFRGNENERAKVRDARQSETPQQTGEDEASLLHADLTIHSSV